MFVLTRPSLSNDDRGAALLLVLIAMAFLTALGLTLTILADTDGRIASSYQAGTETFYAADAVLEWVSHELSVVPSWSDALSGRTRSSLVDATRQPATPSGGRVDLDAITVQLQAQSDATFGGGPNRAVWRLFAWGPLARMIGLDAASSRTYVAAWVADDAADGDDDPAADANGVLTVHAEAFGSAGTRRIIEGVVGQVPAPGERESGSSGGPMFAQGNRPVVPVGMGLAGWSRFGVPAGRSKTVSRGPGALGVRMLVWREVR